MKSGKQITRCNYFHFRLHHVLSSLLLFLFTYLFIIFIAFVCFFGLENDFGTSSANYIYSSRSSLWKHALWVYIRSTSRVRFSNGNQHRFQREIRKKKNIHLYSTCSGWVFDETSGIWFSYYSISAYALIKSAFSLFFFSYGSYCSIRTYLIGAHKKCLCEAQLIRTYNIHINLFITRFFITRFWIQHGSKMDPKNV